MRSMFPGSFEPSAGDILSQWEECIFIIDSSVFISLYHKSSEEFDKVISLLERNKHQIWIPYQAAKIYLDRRELVIAEELKEGQQLRDRLTEEYERIAGYVKDSTNPLIMKLEGDLDILKAALGSFNTRIDENMRSFISYESDRILEALSDIITNDRVGSPVSYQMIETLEEESAQRDLQHLPPFEVEGESGMKRFSALLEWKQIISHIKKVRQPALFITEGHPFHWWKRIDSEVYSPHADLINELNNELRVFFHVCELERFMEVEKLSEAYTTDPQDKLLSFDSSVKEA